MCRSEHLAECQVIHVLVRGRDHEGEGDVEGKELGLITCGSGEGVQGVLTLFCSGAAQVVCHALRVVELSEQLEVEEEGRSRKRRGESKRVPHVDDHGMECESAQDLSHEVCGVS